MSRYTVTTSQRIADAFNKAHPVGSAVVYEEVIGITGQINYKVKNIAFPTRPLGRYSYPVVFLEGKSGWVCVDHIIGWHEGDIKKKLRRKEI